MRWQSLVLKAIARGVSWTRCLSVSRPGLRILTYHTVGQRAYGDELNLNSISLEQFKLHLDVFKDYSCIPLQEMDVSEFETKLAITFDDGYADNLYVVAPLLIERNIPFTVFVTPQFIYEKTKHFLSKSELKELSLLPGVTIGAHGNTHCDLTKCDDERLFAELTYSRSYLEDLLGKTITSMAYPYGATNQRVKAAVEECGYRFAACSYFDINHLDIDPLMLNRSVVLSADSNITLREKIKGDWDWYRYLMNNPLDC
jgi:peptidoglycan/xylan/chitin deacetylase (PgdA/CDA1 family)